MTLVIKPVPVEYLHQTWPLVAGYIASSIDKGTPNSTSDYSLDSVLCLLTSGQWILLVAVDEEDKIQGAMTVAFINYPLNRVAFVTATGGKDVVSKDTFAQLQAIAKHYGATKIQAMARPAMAKLLQTCEMVPCNTMMEFKL